MNFNLKCDKLKRDILKIINESNLPVAVVYYIFQSLFNQIEKEYISTINQLILTEGEGVQKQEKPPFEEQEQEENIIKH